MAALRKGSYDVKDIKLADEGKRRIEWAGQSMPTLAIIRQRFLKQKPLKGMRLSACLHVTTETANLAITLRDGGADVVLCASNPLSTQDETAAALVKHYGIPTFAIKGENNKSYYSHLEAALKHRPHITMDDGADLVTLALTKGAQYAKQIIGGTEETTTGVIRLRSMAAEGVLQYPIMAVNDADTKHMFDNRYGTGQSTLDGVLRATNVLLAGMRVVIAGYGWCGRGIASRSRGMGSHVIVTEVDPTRALEAVMDGYEVMPMGVAAATGDLFITVTGDKNVLTRQHFVKMKDGAIVCNSGHFNVEIDIPALTKLAKSRRIARPFVEEFKLANGRRIYLLADGRLVNLSSAEGHPASVMDMSFADQALCAEYMVKNAKKLEKKVYDVPKSIDQQVAKIKLESMGIKIDKLTPEQVKYLASWSEGT
ncbi:MAG: adenosylhomocysteinase [Acidobacteria bacterium]|nr:adenosylhomocysteinase [Acidobacteriota bacterium]